ncbi:MAG: penicillin-binding transpeptidase domain-containing protein [Eubacteriales bacterium]
MKMKKIREIDHRCFWLMAIMLAMCTILVVKLFELQITRYDEFQNKVIKNIQQETTVSAVRGQIYDRNMAALATNTTTYRLFISPVDIVSAGKSNFETTDEDELSEKEIAEGQAAAAEEYKQKVAERLSEYTVMTADEIVERINQYSTKKDITLEKNLDPDTAELVRKLISELSLNTQVYLEATTKRYYPYSELASAVIGFTGTDGGLIGLELQYDEYLTGTPGRYITTKNAQSQSMPMEYDTYIEPEDGLNLVTTIDVTIQNILEKQLQATYYDSMAANRVTGIVMNPNTGEVYGMGTYPNFDLNDPYTLTESFATLYENWQYDEETANGKTEEESKNEYFWELVYKMWNNKAVNDLYEPGSTFKMITTSAALEEKVVSFQDSFTCTGSLKVAGSTIRCHKAGGHGTNTFDKLLQMSCNPTIMQVAARIGSSTFYSYFEAYGYTSKTGVDLPGESAGLYVAKTGLNAVELACYSFGQTFKTTPIQQLTAISAVANGGYLVTPHLVKALTDKDGNVVVSYDAGIKRQVVSSEVSKAIMAVLQDGVSTGVGVGNAYVAGYRVAAKTGTSEKRDTVDPDDRIGSCVAIAPADDPQVCVIIIVDEPQTSNKYGATVAAPYVAAVMEQILPYLGVERVYTEEEMSRIAVKVGNYGGKTLDAAKKAIEELGLSYEVIGTGETVTAQVPASGEYMTKINGKVILYTGGTGETDPVTVPDLTNMNAALAIRQLYSLGLNVFIEGATNYEEGVGAIVISQSVEPNTRVAYGSVIRITCRYMEQTDGDGDVIE